MGVPGIIARYFSKLDVTFQMYMLSVQISFSIRIGVCARDLSQRTHEHTHAPTRFFPLQEISLIFILLLNDIQINYVWIFTLHYIIFLFITSIQ